MSNHKHWGDILLEKRAEYQGGSLSGTQQEIKNMGPALKGVNTGLNTFKTELPQVKKRLYDSVDNALSYIPRIADSAEGIQQSIPDLGNTFKDALPMILMALFGGGAAGGLLGNM